MVSSVFFRIRLPPQRLIRKVPDETALICRIFPHKVPIFSETTHRIAHCVGIFALYQRFGRIIFKVFFTKRILIIHRADDVRADRLMRIVIFQETLVLHRPGWIHLFYHLVPLNEIFTRPRLVAKAPDYD